MCIFFFHGGVSGFMDWTQVQAFVDGGRRHRARGQDELAAPSERFFFFFCFDRSFSGERGEPFNTVRKEAAGVEHESTHTHLATDGRWSC